MSQVPLGTWDIKLGPIVSTHGGKTGEGILAPFEEQVFFGYCCGIRWTKYVVRNEIQREYLNSTI